jgi:predicted nucleic acid-binding protein
MSLYVIDAGVAVKWFIPELDSNKARELLERFNRSADDLLSPDLLIPETANVFWKRVERGDITWQEAEDNLNDCLALNLPLVPSVLLAQKALTLARAHHRSVYDCLYLALALDRNCHFVTADERLFNAIVAKFPSIKLLRDLQL